MPVECFWSDCTGNNLDPPAPACPVGSYFSCEICDCVTGTTTTTTSSNSPTTTTTTREPCFPPNARLIDPATGLTSDTLEELNIVVGDIVNIEINADCQSDGFNFHIESDNFQLIDVWPDPDGPTVNNLITVSPANYFNQLTWVSQGIVGQRYYLWHDAYINCVQGMPFCLVIEKQFNFQNVQPGIYTITAYWNSVNYGSGSRTFTINVSANPNTTTTTTSSNTPTTTTTTTTSNPNTITSTTTTSSPCQPPNQTIWVQYNNQTYPNRYDCLICKDFCSDFFGPEVTVYNSPEECDTALNATIESYYQLRGVYPSCDCFNGTLNFSISDPPVQETLNSTKLSWSNNAGTLIDPYVFNYLLSVDSHWIFSPTSNGSLHFLSVDDINLEPNQWTLIFAKWDGATLQTLSSVDLSSGFVEIYKAISGQTYLILLKKQTQQNISLNFDASLYFCSDQTTSTTTTVSPTTSTTQGPNTTTTSTTQNPIVTSTTTTTNSPSSSTTTTTTTNPITGVTTTSTTQNPNTTTTSTTTTTNSPNNTTTTSTTTTTNSPTTTTSTTQNPNTTTTTTTINSPNTTTTTTISPNTTTTTCQPISGYTRSISMSLGSKYSNLTNLSAQFVTTSGQDYGCKITSPFVDVGSGNYLLTTQIPFDFRGAIKFYSGTTFLGALAINSEEYEYVDVRVSSRCTGVGTSSSVSKVSFSTDGTEAIELRLTDDYYSSEGRSLDFSSPTWPSLTNSNVLFKVDGKTSFSKQMIIINGSTLRIELSTSELNSIGAGRWSYEIIATLSNNHILTLTIGNLIIIPPFAD